RRARAQFRRLFWRQWFVDGDEFIVLVFAHRKLSPAKWRHFHVSRVQSKFVGLEQCDRWQVIL
ncbi:MAG: hypothetical protein ACTS8S_19410, partial [Giesbergeria sp.]